MARRILLLITDLEIGGTPTVVRELAARLHERGVNVEAACLAPRGPVAAEIEGAGVRVTALGARSVADLRIVKRGAALVRGSGIDTIVSFLIHANTVGALLTLGAPGIRLFQSIQTTQPEPAWHWRLQRWIHPAAERIVVPSPSVARVARQRAGVPEGKIVVIPNAIDVEAFAEVRAAATALAQPAPFPIGFIGRFDPVKRIGDLIEATARLGGRVHLHLFGDGPERPTLEARATRADLAGRVTFHGMVRRPQEALGQVQALVLPSAAEGFGLVLIEAMAAGVPVIGTDVPGIRDVIRAGVSGLLAECGNPAALADAIARVIDDASMRRRLAESAMEDVRRRFSWERALDAWCRLLGV